MGIFSADTMRPLLAIVTAILLSAAFILSGTRVRAQMPPATAPPVPEPATADSATEGTLTTVSATRATLQTPDGHSVQLALRPRGYLFVDPTTQPLSAGMRVYAIGFPNADGSLAVDEIDVLVPQNLLMQTPAPAQT